MSTLPISVPNTFANATTAIPLSQLDNNFTTVVTALNGVGNGSTALSNVVITGGTANLLTANVNSAVLLTANIGNANITGTLTANVDFVSTANANVSNVNVSNNANVSGNITVGNATSNVHINNAGTITATNTIAATGNISGGNVTTTGVVSATGNVSGGNLTTTGITATGSLTATTTVSATGNVSGGNITTGGVVAATGNVSGGNLTTVGVVSATGNVSGGNLTTTGITATGSLTATTTVAATGNVSGGNLVTAGYVNATGNVIGGNVTANTNVSAGNASITNNVSAANLAVTAAANFTGATVTGLSVSTNAVSAINGGPIAGLRNRIINGDMRVDQRNSGSATTTSTSAWTYTVDRWYSYSTGATVSGTRTAGSGGSQYRYQFTGAASVTGIYFGQRIESTNIWDLAGGTVSLGVDMSTTSATTVTWTAYYPTTADSYGTFASPTRTSVATGTFSVTSTLTRFTANITLSSSNTNGLEIVFNVGSFTSGTWTIGNVQIEGGSTASTFERRSIGLEYALCQRYYYSNWSDPLFFYTTGISTPTAAVSVVWFFKQEMRVAPTLSYTTNYLSSLSASYTDTTSTRLVATATDASNTARLVTVSATAEL